MATGEHGTRRGVRAAMLTAMLATALPGGPFVGCAPRATEPVISGGVDAGGADLESELKEAERLLGAIIDSHNLRASRLDTLESRASLELRYRDSDGEHFDQCEADIFLASGDRGALRATKVGTNLLWVGSDGVRGWVFLLEKDPTSLTVYDRVDTRAWSSALDGGAADELILLAPKSVRTLGGMHAIPADARVVRLPDAPSGAPAGGSVLDRHAVVYAPFAGCEIALRFTADGLPAEVRVLDRGDGPRFVARLSEYTPAPAANLAQGAWPKVPRRIEVDAARRGATVRIYLDEPAAMMRRMKPRFFSLEELTAQLRPDSVKHVLAIDPVEAGGDAGAGSAAGSVP